MSSSEIKEDNPKEENENNSGDIDKTEFSKLTDVLGLELTEKTI